MLLARPLRVKLRLIRPPWVFCRFAGGLKRFLCALSGETDQRITGARKGKPFGRRFFDSIPWSRIVGKDFLEVRRYIIQNTLEALGLIPYQKRNKPRRI